jgi:hypothetical protein
MGTAGLDTEKLAGLLERKKLNCLVIDDDRARDHCVIKIRTRRRPGIVAFVEYENQGTEPRLAGIMIRPETIEVSQESYPLDWDKVLKLSGKRCLDAEILARWGTEIFVTEHLPNASIDCPCCANKTLDGAGNHEICPVCFWEDDPVQRDDPAYPGGANRISLKQAKRNFLEIGWCDERAKSLYTPNPYFNPLHK